MRRLATLAAAFLLVSTVFAQAPAADSVQKSAAELPVKRVVLYKNGVGYFEHAGRVIGSQELNIQFTTGQLNDVLKSLTVVDLGGGKITGVRYNSIAPLSERLSTLRVRLGEQTTRMDFLNALRGARVEVRNGTASAVGKLLSVEMTQRQVGKDEILQQPQIALVTDSGELRTFDLGPSTAVRIAEGELTQEIGRYLNLIGTSRAKDLRRMTISTAGSGDRNIFVSYISEVPVWKSTYRIVLPKDPKNKPLLQGWAIVDNTIGEDWKDVQLSLVAGAPQSFVQQISQPLYVRRPTVELPETAQLTPQTHEATTDEEVEAEVDNGALRVPAVIPRKIATIRDEVAPLPPPVGGSVGSGSGGGIGVGRYRVDGASNTSNAFIVNRSAGITPEAEGKVLGDMFEYALQQKITVLKNQSALVPIVQSPLETQRVTLWNSGMTQPLRAMWIRNNTGLTLDGGTFNIIEGDAFAGEGLMDELRPSERRLLSYAVDTAVHVTYDERSLSQPVTRLRAVKGVMKLTREVRENVTYHIRNSDAQPREVVIEHPARTGWKLVDELKPEETTASSHRFVVKVDPGKSADFKVEQYMPTETQYVLSNLTSEQLTLFVSEKSVSPELEKALKKIVDKKSEIAAVDRDLNSRRQEITRISTEQSRLRENMQVLKGSSEEKALLQRYVQQLNQQEDRLSALNREINDRESKRIQMSAELDQMVQQIALDEKP